MTFAEKIKNLRAKMGFTQSKLAKALGVTQSAISCWENGITSCQDPVLLKLKKICDKKMIKINWGK